MLDAEDEFAAQRWIDEALDEGSSGADLLTALHSKGELTVARVQSELHLALNRIEGSTFELVREKYADYVRVAASVSGCSDECAPTRNALVALHSAVTAVAIETAAERLRTEDALAARVERRTAQREVGAAERFEAALRKLEDLMATPSMDAPAPGDLADDAAPWSVERAAHAALGARATLDRAVDYVRNGVLVARIHAHAHRVAACENDVQSLVLAEFARTCAEQHAPESLKRGAQSDFDDRVGSVVRAAAALGLGKALEAEYAARVVAGFVRATFTQGRLDGGRRGSCDGLGSIFDAALHFIRERCGKTLAASENAMAPEDGDDEAEYGEENGEDKGAEKDATPQRSSLLGVDLVVRGVWRCVAAAISDQLSSMFDLGIAATAHSSYSATLRFLDGLAAIAADGDSARTKSLSRRLRGSDEMKALETRWNLPVYFELVRADMRRRLEAAHLQALTSTMYHAALQEALRCVEACWSAGVVLQPLLHSFLALSFEIVRVEALEKVETALQCANDQDDADAADSGTWADSAASLAFLARDVALLESGLKASLVGLVAAQVDQPLDVRADVFAALEAVFAPASALEEKCWARVQSKLHAQCLRRLKSVKGVTARFHLTGAPFPLAPSAYVSDALWPLAAFASLRRAPKNDHGEWASQLQDAVAHSVVGLVEDVRAHAAKFAETLRKRRQSVAAAGDDSDAAKIDAQLRLDVVSLRSQLALADDSVWLPLQAALKLDDAPETLEGYAPEENGRDV